MGRTAFPSCNWTFEREIMLAGVGFPEPFDAVSGICWVGSGAFTAMGEVLLGAGCGIFVSNGVEEILRSAT
jgi:hypothetical protein